MLRGQRGTVQRRRAVRGVVLEAGPRRGPSAAGSGTRRMPELGQVPEHDAGVVALYFVPVVAVADGKGRDLDQHVLQAGGEPPGARAAIGSEGEPGTTAGRVVPVTFSSFHRPGAAVADRMALAVGDGEAPGGPGVAGGGRSEIAGQARVDGADPSNSPGWGGPDLPMRACSLRVYSYGS